MKAKVIIALLLALVFAGLRVNAQEPAKGQTNQIVVVMKLGWFGGSRQYHLAAGATVLDAIAAIDEKTKSKEDLGLHRIRLMRKNADGRATTPIRINVDEQRRDPSKATVLETGDILEIRSNSISPPI